MGLAISSADLLHHGRVCPKPRFEFLDGNANQPSNRSAAYLAAF
jgi:hypothetical protein